MYRHQAGRSAAAISVHEHMPLVVVGSRQRQMLKIVDFLGNTVESIKYQKGFMGNRLGAVNALAFHPTSPLLVTGHASEISMFVHTTT